MVSRALSTNTTPSLRARVSFQIPATVGAPRASRYTGTSDGLPVPWICPVSEPASIAAWIPGPRVKSPWPPQ